MSTHRNIDVICSVIAALTLVLTIFFMNGEALGISVIADEDEADGMFTENDLTDDWDTAGATEIVLSDNGCLVNGNGAYANGNTVTVVYAGRYVVSGSLSDGQIVVDADGDDKVWLGFDSVSVHMEDDAALRIEQAGKVFLTLKDGTENVLSSGALYNSAAVSAGVDGAIYSRDDLTVNGGGSLTVETKYSHGIVCNDDMVFTGGNVTVKAPRDGIHANDSVRIKDCELTVSAGDDGITAANDDETSFFHMESGRLSIPECYEGIEAVEVNVAGGTIAITPTDDGINANSYGGNAQISVTGGDITVTNPTGRDADGLDSNHDIFISGGRLLISVANDGSSCALDYAGTCKISGGTVLACGSAGMAEGFDSSSEQGFIMMNTSASDGTQVTLKNENGDVLISETVPCGFSSLIASAPGMKVGDVCGLVIGDKETTLTVDNQSTSSGFGGGMRPGGGRFKGDISPTGGTGTEPGGGTGDTSSDNAGANPVSGANTSPSDFRGADSAGTAGMNRSAGTDGSQASGAAANTSDETYWENQPPAEPPRNPGDTRLPAEGMTGDETTDGGAAGGGDGITGAGMTGGRGGRDMTGIRDQGAAGAADATNDTPSNISAETMIPVGISAAVLLAGLAVALFYRRRG